MINEIDLKILNLLQKDSSLSNAAIAKEIGLTASATFERIKKLDEKGIIKGYSLVLDPKKLDFSTLAFVFVQTDETLGNEAWEGLMKIPEVQEIHNVAGEDCYLVKVRTKDTEALSLLLRKFLMIPLVRSTRTTVVLETKKETSYLPVEVINKD